LAFRSYPDEELPVQYEASLADDSRLPSWISFDRDRQNFQLESVTPEGIGEYELKTYARFHLFPDKVITSKFKVKITIDDEEKATVAELAPSLSEDLLEAIEANEEKQRINNGFTPDQILEPDDENKPDVWVRKINQFGAVTIAFTEYMFTPDYKALAEE